MFCNHCGAEINDQAVVCVKCGCSVKSEPANTVKPYDPDASPLSGVTVLLLCFFVGTFGVHNFYVGRTGVGVAQLLTLGGCGIWTLVDLIMIATGSFKDSYGRIVKL